MQSSKTTNDLCKENEPNRHKPVHHARSHDINAQKHQRQNKHQHHSPMENSRFTSSGIRHSIRNLTSCTLLRRKSHRSTDIEDSNVSRIESSGVFDDDYRKSSKALLIPPRSFSSSPSGNKCKSRIQSSISANSDTIGPGKKNSNSTDETGIEMSSNISNVCAVNSSSHLLLKPSNDILLPNARILSGKEISTSLVNLMGTASDSVPINNATQIPTQSYRAFSTTAGSTERLGVLGSSPNAATQLMITPPTIQRTLSTESNTQCPTSPSAYTKSTNQYTWCYENSITVNTNNGNNVEECVPRLEIDNTPLIYREQFMTSEHFNWYGTSDTRGPVIISFKYSTDQDKQRYILAIVRTRQRTSIESLLDVQSSLSSIDILRRICDQCAITDIEYFDPLLCEGGSELLIKYDESYVSNRHKFGIIYQRENQLTEEEIFSNETHSNAMDKFLDFIGNRVKLKDFQGFRGGLDVKSDHTGTESIYEQFKNHEIMFHVSTLLPYSKIERQQLERKRHIGNDIVAIVFQDSDTKFNPECIASQFLHVYLVVTPLDELCNQFKISVIHRDTVPFFGPVLNHLNSFDCNQTFKQWLLAKLINAEIASCKTSIFQKYQERTKMHLFDNLYRTLHNNNRPIMNSILNHSQYKHECDVEQQKDDVPTFPSPKTYDRHTDNSLLGSVRRRLIAPKARTQHSITPPPTTIVVSTQTSNNQNELKSKASSTIMDLKQSASKESMVPNSSNGKLSSLFFPSKNQTSSAEKSPTNRSLLDIENNDVSLNSRSGLKFLSPLPSPLPSFNYYDYNIDSCSSGTSFNFNKLTIDNLDSDNQYQLSNDYLQASTKDELIKFVVALQQQYSSKLAQMDETHSKALKELEIQLIQQRNTVDRDSSSN